MLLVDSIDAGKTQVLCKNSIYLKALLVIGIIQCSANRALNNYINDLDETAYIGDYIFIRVSVK